jgi:hypothetical protein
MHTEALWGVFLGNVNFEHRHSGWKVIRKMDPDKDEREDRRCRISCQAVAFALLNLRGLLS